MAIGIETNIIYQGDCKEVLRNFPSESIDLIYVDPPFFSNKNYEVIWGNGAELKAFEDRWKGGIQHYISWMTERVEQMYRVLKKSGSIFLHCDYNASHYLKVFALDKIFGDNNFRNEIIWCYSHGGKGKKSFGWKHDTIFFYSKSSDYTFNSNAVRIPMKSGLTSFGGRLEVDKEGRKYRLVYGTKDSKGKTKYYKYYLDEGKIPEDYWTDINSIQSGSAERLGYPTQKPEKLLERIILTSSNENDIILDPMMGGGTTLAVAEKNKRRWIGIDVSPLACQMTSQRLRKLGISSVPIIGGAITEKELRNFKPFEFQKWVCDKLFGRISDRKSSDMGIDGYTLDGIPIQVKQSDGVGRNVVDNFETAIRRVKKNKGIIVAFSFGKGAYEESARVKLDEDVEIKLVTVKELLKGQDTAEIMEFKGA